MPPRSAALEERGWKMRWEVVIFVEGVIIKILRQRKTENKILSLERN